MDLIETSHQHSNRHPWEIARVIALKQILARTLVTKKYPKILDIGCGDGFVSRCLFNRDKQVSVTCLDINFISD